MAEEKLTPIEERWAKGWVHGLARVLATPPPGEPPEVTRAHVEEIERIAESGPEAREFAHRWREHLLKALGV